MRILLLAALLCGSLGAQTLGFYVDNSNGGQPTNQLTPFPAEYPFPDTPEGGSSSVVVRMVNLSSAPAQVTGVFVGAGPLSSVATPNFTVTGSLTLITLAPQAWKEFTVNFTPAMLGVASGYLQVFVNGATQSVAVLQGNGTAPQLTLSCNSSIAPQCNGSTLQPNSETFINFGNVNTTASVSIPFTLTNMSASAVNPQQLISLAIPTNNPSTPFALSTLPDTLAAGSSLTFNVTFAPGNAINTTTNLILGNLTYTLEGAGVSSVTGDISSLVITYVDSTGVRLTAQPASAINFGQTVSGTNGSATLTFTVTNPQTTIYAVSVPSVTISGSGFTLTGLPTMPSTIQPGQAITFQVVFSGPTTGTYNGTLAIGTRQFSLTGQSITSPIPAASFQLNQQPLTSQQQAQLSIELASASPVSAIGVLQMQFTPSVANVTDDPAINFVATSGRQLQVSVASGAQTATYNGQSAITFQTGTTAGTITFTLTFPNTAPYSQSFTISPAQITITTASAVQQAPNLVVTLTGYDNTYSAGQLSFNFYDTTGKLINSNPIQVNATSSFQQYFFTNDKAGGAFSLQASFPVTGDVTQVGSVAVSISNSVGTTTSNQTFQ